MMKKSSQSCERCIYRCWWLQVTCLAQNLGHALVMCHLSKVGSTGQCMCHPHEAWTILFFQPTNPSPSIRSHMEEASLSLLRGAQGGSLPVFTFCSSVVHCLHSGTLCTIIEANRSGVGMDWPTMAAAKAEPRGRTQPLPWPKPGVGPFPGLANFLLFWEFTRRLPNSGHTYSIQTLFRALTPLYLMGSHYVTRTWVQEHVQVSDLFEAKL